MPGPSTNGQRACGVLRRARYQGRKTGHNINVPSPHRSGTVTRLRAPSKTTQTAEIKGTAPNKSRVFSGPETSKMITAASHDTDNTNQNILHGNRTDSAASSGASERRNSVPNSGLPISAGLIARLHDTQTRHAAASICPQAGQGNGSLGKALLGSDGAASVILWKRSAELSRSVISAVAGILQPFSDWLVLYSRSILRARSSRESAAVLPCAEACRRA